METANTLKPELVFHTTDESNINGSPRGSRTRTPMSSSLKERLKRSRRSFSSPFSAAKRVKGADSDRAGSGAGEESEVRARSDLVRLRAELKKDVGEKTEKLRRLRMAQMYRTKNDATQLRSLVDKWRRTAQAALLELRASLPDNPALPQLIDHLGLDDGALRFDRAEGAFEDP